MINYDRWNEIKKKINLNSTRDTSLDVSWIFSYNGVE